MSLYIYIRKMVLSGENPVIELVRTCNFNEYDSIENSVMKEYLDNGYKLLNDQKGGSGIITKAYRSSESIKRSNDRKKKPVIQLLNGKEVNRFDSIDEATVIMGYHRNCIRNAVICGGKSHKFHWKLFKI